MKILKPKNTAAKTFPHHLTPGGVTFLDVLTLGLLTPMGCSLQALKSICSHREDQDHGMASHEEPPIPTHPSF